MESVIAAMLVLTLALVGGLTLVESSMAAHEAAMLSWQVAAAQAEIRARTAVSALGAETQSSGAIVVLSVQNTGSTKLADFDTWDVIVQYQSVQGARVVWLPYVGGEPGQNQWTVAGIYLDAATGQQEVYEPGIVNPGEDMVVRLRLHPPVAVNSTNLVTIVTDAGIGTAATFTR